MYSAAGILRRCEAKWNSIEPIQNRWPWLCLWCYWLVMALIFRY